MKKYSLHIHKNIKKMYIILRYTLKYLSKIFK